MRFAGSAELCRVPDTTRSRHGAAATFSERPSWGERSLREPILDLLESAWEQAVDAEGVEREGAWIAELSDHVGICAWPEGTRLIVRRERPHPRRPVRGLRRTRLPPHRLHHRSRWHRHRRPGAAPPLPRQSRGRDPLRKETGMRNMPLAAFEHNQVWLELSLIPPRSSFAGAPFSACRATLPSPSPSGFASVCSTSPDESLARAGAPRCGCRAPGRGRKRWGRPSRACGRCRWALGHSHLTTRPLTSIPADPDGLAMFASETGVSRVVLDSSPGDRRGGFAEPPWRRYLAEVRQSHSAR